MPIRANNDGWGEKARWRIAEEALTRISKNEVIRRHLFYLALAAGLRECVGALQREHRHVQISRKSVGGTYWSLRCSWGEEVRWRTAEGALTHISVNEVSRRHLL